MCGDWVAHNECRQRQAGTQGRTALADRANGRPDGPLAQTGEHLTIVQAPRAGAGNRISRQGVPGGQVAALLWLQEAAWQVARRRRWADGGYAGH